jgi:hypothetical protein
MEILKEILAFLAEHPVKSFFFLLAFRPLKLVSFTGDVFKKDNT